MQDTLRFLTCGSVDAGKSTLIGRLLMESKQVFDDQLQAVREQGVTTDLPYRSFATTGHLFAAADTPGDKQYTRNLVAGASTSDVAVLVVDAQQGLQLQTYRDARIVALLGIRHVVMAVNKMDLVDWDQAAFSRIHDEFQPLVDALGFESFQPIPVSALDGGNITERSSAAPWYEGPKLLTYLEEVNVVRGDVIASASDSAALSDQFEAKVLCLSEHPLVAGRSYRFSLNSSQAVATITAIKYQVDAERGTHLAARALGLSEIGVVNLSIDRPVPFEEHDQRSRVGSFILVDRLSNQTVAAGMIEFALRRAANIHWQAMDIDKAARADQKLQKPVCLWFTGLSASGKSTIANLLEKRMFAMGRHTYLLDGDNVRHGLNRDLGFSEADRVENIRRITEVARLLVDAGLVAIVSFISPYRGEREIARSRFEAGEFLEIFVDTPIEECERRDPKGLYAKARSGELVNFTGIDSRYEPPESPEIRLDTLAQSAEQCVDRILFALDQRQLQNTLDTRGTS